MKAQAMNKIAELVNEAFQKASAATAAAIAANPDTWYPCGFAWVRIRPASGPLVKYLKEHELGRTDDYAGGFVVHNPSGNYTQWMDAKAAGAQAFAEHLTVAGYKATAETRID